MAPIVHENSAPSSRQPRHVPGLTHLVHLDLMTRHLLVDACVKSSTGYYDQIEKQAKKDSEPSAEQQIRLKPVQFSEADKIERLKRLVDYDSVVDHHSALDENFQTAEAGWRMASESARIGYAEAMREHRRLLEMGRQSDPPKLELPKRPEVTAKDRRGEAHDFVFPKGVYSWARAILKDKARWGAGDTQYTPELYAAFDLRTEEADLDLPEECFKEPPAETGKEGGAP